MSLREQVRLLEKKAERHEQELLELWGLMECLDIKRDMQVKRMEEKLAEQFKHKVET